MDMDTLITVVFVAVIIAFQLFGSVAGRLLKQKRTAPASGQPAKKEGLMTRINREIQRAMEEAAAKQRGASQGEASPDLVMEEATAAEEEPEKKPAPVVRRAVFRKTTPDRPAIKKPERRVVVKATPSVARPVVKEKEKPAAVSAAAEDKSLMADLRQGLLDAAAAEKSGTGAAITVEDSHASAGSEPGAEYEGAELRRAVIWSEILAPPVALRDL